MTTTGVPAGTRSRRGGALLIGALLVCVLLAVLAVAGVAGWRGLGDEEVPYDDPRSTGSLTLCSADGEPVTEGSVDDRPFAAVVVGETGLPAKADPAGAVGTLYGYQPRAGVAPAEFSGSQITAATRLGEPAEPAVAVTADAWSIGDFAAAFPADLDGYVQLRLLLGTPAHGTLLDGYDTADLRIEGDTWHLVSGGRASCAGARAAIPGS